MTTPQVVATMALLIVAVLAIDGLRAYSKWKKKRSQPRKKR